MSPIMPDLRNIPGARVIVNSLFDSRVPGCLAQDLLLVEVPGGTFIDVSWFPEHDPSGSYFVTVLRNGEEMLQDEVKTAYEAISRLVSMAEFFARPIGNVSRSSSCVATYPFSTAA